MSADWIKRNERIVWIAGGVAGAIVLLLIIGAFARLVDPAPPRSITLATGSPSGAYFAGGEDIAAFLREKGISVEVLSTSGSVENFDLLTSDDADVDAAFMQGGVGVGQPGSETVQSLAGVFFEPVWVFVRADADVADLRGLEGGRIAAGPTGSGTRALTRMLLTDNGVTNAQFLDEGGEEAAQALLAGQADAAVFVVAPRRPGEDMQTLVRPYIYELMTNPRTRLLSFDRAESYARLHHYLSNVSLPEGVVDMARNVPAEEVRLIAPAAAVVVREDLHPAIQELILEAIHELYSLGDVIAPPRAFPSQDLVPFPLSENAERYFERGGPSFLARYLPFWAANMVDRLWVLVIPLATLLYPLVKTAPPVYRWQVRRRIHIWYRDLRRLEHEGLAAAEDDAERDRVHGELARILEEVGQLDVPLPYNDDVYRLRAHIRMVDDIIARRAVEAGHAA